MRTESAAQAKAPHRAANQRVPRQGSRMRALYDVLMKNKGLVVTLVLRNDDRGSGPGRYVLAGEWFGREYRDYIAERITPEKEPGQ